MFKENRGKLAIFPACWGYTQPNPTSLLCVYIFIGITRINFRLYWVKIAWFVYNYSPFFEVLQKMFRQLAFHLTTGTKFFWALFSLYSWWFCNAGCVVYIQFFERSFRPTGASAWFDMTLYICPTYHHVWKMIFHRYAKKKELLLSVIIIWLRHLIFDKKNVERCCRIESEGTLYHRCFSRIDRR